MKFFTPLPLEYEGIKEYPVSDDFVQRLSNVRLALGTMMNQQNLFPAEAREIIMANVQKFQEAAEVFKGHYGVSLFDVEKGDVIKVKDTLKVAPEYIEMVEFFNSALEAFDHEAFMTVQGENPLDANS